MSDSITIKLDLKSIERAFNKLLNSVEDLEPSMETIAAILETAARENIESEGDGAPDAWQDLSDVTIKAREKKGQVPIHKLLVDGMNAGLMSSIAADSGKDYAAAGIEGDSDLLGKAIAHQFGTDSAGRNKSIAIPKREFLYLTDEYEEEIVTVIEDMIDQALKG